MKTVAIDRNLREHLLKSLQGAQAFDSIDEILAEIPKDRRFAVGDGMERSAWQVLEHMRLSIEDLVSYIDDDHYKELGWPDGYWPSAPDPKDPGAWGSSAVGFNRAQKRLEEIVQDPARDLLAPLANGPDHTILREVLLAVAHNAYHAGQLVEIARALGEP